MRFTPRICSVSDDEDGDGNLTDVSGSDSVLVDNARKSANIQENRVTNRTPVPETISTSSRSDGE